MWTTVLVLTLVATADTGQDCGEIGRASAVVGAVHGGDDVEEAVLLETCCDSQVYPLRW